MRVYRLLATACLTAALASACAAPSTPKAATTGAKPGSVLAPAGSVAAGAAVSGRLMAPAGVVSAGGANVVSAGGANVVSAGGANVVSAGGANLTGGFRTLGLTERPLAGAEVFLAGADGAPVAGGLKAVTDAQGNFRIPKAPVGFTFVVATRVKTAEGKDAVLKTLVGTAAAGARADLSAASTLLTESLMARAGAKLGSFDAAAFARAVGATSARMSDEALPDLADREAMLRYFGELEAAVAELKGLLADMGRDLAKVEQRVDDLQAQLDQLAKQSPLPVALPSIALPGMTEPGAGVGEPGPGPASPTPAPTATPGTAAAIVQFTDFTLADPGADATVNRGARDVQMMAGPGNDLAPGAGMSAPRLTTPVSGDFSITVRLQIAPSTDFSAGGLVVVAGNQSILRFERNTAGTALLVTIDGAPVTVSGATRAYASQDCYLRLTRTGNLFTTAYRGATGTTWYEAASGTFALPARVDVGVAVARTGTAAGQVQANFSELSLEGRPN